MKTMQDRKYRISFIIVLTCVMLSFLVGIGSLLAWLTYEYEVSNNESNLGVVAKSVRVNGSENNNVVTMTLGSGSSRSVNLKIRNTGTIDALLRVTIRIYYLDENNNQVNALLTNDLSGKGANFIKLNTTNWVYLFPENNAVASGYMFYNAKVQPYNINGSDVTANEVSIIDSIQVNSEQTNTTFYIELSASDMIAWAGNIYRKIELGQTGTSNIPVEAYPYGLKENLPAGWTIWK